MKYILLGIYWVCCIHTICAQDDSMKVVNLDRVLVKAPLTKAQIIEQQAIKATVIDTKSLDIQPANLTELMNRTVGIRVRQTGGLGSNTDLMLNGFEGKAIKYFKDGIPMDYLGWAFSFSIVPVNMVERIEVYKGMLPISLGADALGGAVNMVTKQDERSNRWDFSYQYGSFNTHRVSVHGLWKDAEERFFAGADIFYNYSDNDYQASVSIVDSETAVKHREKRPLFHNRFSSFYTEVFAGIINRPWADELRVGLTYFDLKRDNNYGITMDRPFGGVVSGSHSFIPTVRYRKNFWDNKVKFDQFVVYNHLYGNYTDTVQGIYDWYGHFTHIPSRKGEATTEGSLTKLKYENFISRSNISVPLNYYHTAEANMVYSQVTRTGSNPLGDKFPQSGLDVLSVPAKYNKLVVAGGVKSYFFDGRLSNDILVKYFHSATKGNEGSYATQEEGWEENFIDRWGFGDALKYSFSGNAYVRLSGETTVRLPEQSEVFGDGGFVESNFSLSSERSYNINLGGYYSTSSFTVESNLFYRRTYDLILLINTGMFGKYQNVNKVKGVGLELDAAYSVLPWLKVNGNLTYQDFRLFGQNDVAYEGARLRNTPFFFANLGVNAEFQNLIRKKDRISFYWNYGFVRAYYLNYIPRPYEPDGFLGLWGKPSVNVESLTIPDQSLHTIGCSWWADRNRGFAVGMEVKNLFDAEIYDNYRIQNAGRSFYIKLNYTL